MSSQPKGKGGAAAAGAKGKGAPGKDKESKAVKGPVVTPQALGIVFGLILVIGIPVFYSNVIKKQQDEIAAIRANISTQQGLVQTYQKKGAKKNEADKLNKALKQKLSTLDYLFLEDQSSVLPFYETTFFPLLNGSNLRPTADSKITVTPYTFRINMAMRPYETLPGSALFENADDVFGIAYIPEQNGNPWEEPIDTRPGVFLEPYDIRMEGFAGTFADVKRFIESLQDKSNDKLITVHCLKNDEGKNSGGFRTSTQWEIAMTVYFINPEMAASGDAPPSPPGANSC